MKKSSVFFLLLSCGMVSCQTNASSSAPETSSLASGSVSSTLSEVSSLSSAEESSASVIDYSLFDENLIGKWYVHSSSMGVLQINQEIEVFADYSLSIASIHFTFRGMYYDYEGTNLFLSDSGITTFTVSYDGEYMDWAFEDTAGYKDFGVAKREMFSNEIQYSYVGPDWPIDRINAFLGTEGTIPEYEAEEYSLYTGISQLYDDAPYCMIDIFDVPSTALRTYVSTLNQNGFSIVKDTSSEFYIGYDDNRIYSLRLIEFGDDNLCIFVYAYQTLSYLF